MRNILFLLCILCTAIEGRAADGKIYFNHLKTDNGLSSNTINCIYKDKTGFLWMGTTAGLNRFDGYEFKQLYHQVDNHPYSDGNVFSITESFDGDLWITYHNNRISVLSAKRESFLTLEEKAAELGIEVPIAKVYRNKECKLLFSSTDNTLWLYDENHHTSRSIQTDRKLKVSDLHLHNQLIYVLYESGKLDLIDLTRNRLLESVSGMETPTHTGFYRLFVDSKGDAWIYLPTSNRYGLQRYESTYKRWSHLHTTSSFALSSDIVCGVEEDGNGDIWIATDHGGLNIYNKETNAIACLKHDPFDSRSISQNSIMSLYRDDNGIIWAGTAKSGISYFHESILKFDLIRQPIYTADNGLINDCGSLYEDKEGFLWIATDGNGLLKYDRKTRRYINYKHNPSDPASVSSNVLVTITGGESGEIWVGTYLGGFNRFDGKRFERFRIEGAESAGSVYGFYADKEYLWLATQGRGILAMNLATRKTIRLRPVGLSDTTYYNYIHRFTPSPDGGLLAAASDGVIHINRQTFVAREYFAGSNYESTMRGKIVHTLMFDSRGLLWIGGSKILQVYDSARDTLFSIGAKTDLEGNSFLSMQEDEFGNLWIGTKNGLLHITVTTRPDGTLAFDPLFYNENEGVQGRFFNVNGSYKLSTGELAFAGTNGITLFKPSQIRYNFAPPKVVFTTMAILNVPKGSQGTTLAGISYLKEVSLNYGERSFTIVPSVINYFLPEKTVFYYRLKGFDREWNRGDASNRFITYTNLSPGKYTLEVKALNNDGVWSQSPAELTIIIRSPLWGTPWAILLYIVLGALFLYYGIKGVLRIQARKFAVERENIENKKMLEVDEMKLRFFTNVSHEFRMPLTLIITPLEKLLKQEHSPANRKLLQTILQNAQRLLTLVNQLLDFRKIDTHREQLNLSIGDIVSFVREITYVFKEHAEQKGLCLSFSSECYSLSMKFDKDKVYKIVSNLLGNALKFTQQGNISVRLFLSRNDELGTCVGLEVSDTGMGIKADDCELIFSRFYQVVSDTTSTNTGSGIGLHLCREFVQMHNGRIGVESVAGKGSTFRILLPMVQADVNEVVTSVSPDAAGPSEEASTFGAENGPLDENRSTLLLVDDNTDFLEFMQQSLCDRFTIWTARDGEEAWTVILEKNPDMVVSDVMMPGVDGITLCRRIKEDIRTSHIPVILLTAKTAEESEVEGLEAGADDYMGKPFNLDRLTVKIRHLIDRKTKMQQLLLRQSDTSIRLSDIAIGSLDEQLIVRVIEYVEQHLSDPDLSIDNLSKEMGMSRATFYKKIQSITGKTPAEFLRIIRLKKAVQLLQSGVLRVNEVAYEVGFSDVKLFRKHFKEEFGRLPSEYNK